MSGLSRVCACGLDRGETLLAASRTRVRIGSRCAGAYNLALQLCRTDLVLKLDADTWLDGEAVEAQRAKLAPAGFLRGCRDAAPDENARHLNGVLLARRSDLLRVRGYDERMRKCTRFKAHARCLALT
jgi:hypothetical protein